MSSEIGIGLVGCGRLAEVGYVPAAERAPGVSIRAVADPDPSRRARVAGMVSSREVACFDDLAGMLDGAAVDAVVLATPAAVHVGDARLAVQRGLPVLVEKPPAPDAAGTAELVALGDLVSVGFNRRFDGGARALRAALPDGEPVEMLVEIRYRRASWGAHVVRDEVLLDLVPHLVDWALWLTRSRPASVLTRRLEVDAVTLELALGGGRATILAAADRLHRERIEVRDRSGTRIGRHRVGGVASAVRGRFVGRGRRHPLVDSLTEQLVTFARVAPGDDRREPELPGQLPEQLLGTAADGHAVMRVIDAARLSADRGGRAVTVPDPSEPLPC
jgi:predicted dehydrogenase